MEQVAVAYDDQVVFLRVELARKQRELDAALESERRLWRAFVVAKGAAEYVNGLLYGWMADGATITNDALSNTRDYVFDEIVHAEKLSGCAVES